MNTEISEAAQQPPASNRWTSTDERRSEMLSDALLEKDPILADPLESEFVERYIRPDVRAHDVYALQLRNARYGRLTPLRATDLLADVYNANYQFGTYGLRATTESEIAEGLIRASLEQIRHLFRIRQDADVLGYEYDDYVALLFKLHWGRGHKAPPTLKEMHGELVTMAIICHLRTDSDDPEPSDPSVSTEEQAATSQN